MVLPWFTEGLTGAARYKDSTSKVARSCSWWGELVVGQGPQVFFFFFTPSSPQGCLSISSAWQLPSPPRLFQPYLLPTFPQIQLAFVPHRQQACSPAPSRVRRGPQVGDGRLGSLLGSPTHLLFCFRKALSCCRILGRYLQIFLFLDITSQASCFPFLLTWAEEQIVGKGSGFFQSKCKLPSAEHMLRSEQSWIVLTISSPPL